MRTSTCIDASRFVFKKKVTYLLWKSPIYGAQNEAYRMTEGRKMGEVVSLQIVRRNLMIEAPQNETFT